MSFIFHRKFRLIYIGSVGGGLSNGPAGFIDGGQKGIGHGVALGQDIGKNGK